MHSLFPCFVVMLAHFAKQFLYSDTSTYFEPLTACFELAALRRMLSQSVLRKLFATKSARCMRVLKAAERQIREICVRKSEVFNLMNSPRVRNAQHQYAEEGHYGLSALCPICGQVLILPEQDRGSKVGYVWLCGHLVIILMLIIKVQYEYCLCVTRLQANKI